MQLETRNLFIDTQYFLGKGLNFDTNELQSLASLAQNCSLKVYLTDINDLEIVKKIFEQVEVAFGKINVSDVRILKQIPLYRKFHSTYDEKKAVNFILNAYEKFKTDCRTEIISSGQISFMQIFQDYTQGKKPFNSTPGKNRKAEFPDAFALAAIKNWTRTKKQKTYIISGDSDWELFSDDHELFHLTDLSDLINLVIRHEEGLHDLTKFADDLIESKREKIEKHMLNKLRNSAYEGHDEELDIRIQKSYIISATMLNKSVLSVSRDSCIYYIEFDVLAIFKYGVINYSEAVYDKEDGQYLGLEEQTVHLKHQFTLGIDVTFQFKDAVPGNFRIIADETPDAIEIDYVEGELANLQEWALSMPILVCGVSNGKLTENGGGTQRFKTIVEAKKIFDDLDIYKSGKRFTKGMGDRITGEIRFETWKAYDFYSS
jgi:hypothetical protein